MKLEYIEWEDVLSAGSGWYSEDELSEWKKDCNKAFIVHQCGFVVEETDDYILLCSHYHPESKLLFAQYGHLQKIVKSLIRKRKKIII